VVRPATIFARGEIGLAAWSLDVRFMVVPFYRKE
jgi:hypothetical protein